MGRNRRKEAPSALVEQPVHWTALRKAEVVRGIINGDLTRDQAKERFDLSDAELAIWEARYEGRGLAGLQVKDIPATRITRHG